MSSLKTYLKVIFEKCWSKKEIAEKHYCCTGIMQRPRIKSILQVPNRQTDKYAILFSFDRGPPSSVHRRLPRQRRHEEDRKVQEAPGGAGGAGRVGRRSGRGQGGKKTFRFTHKLLRSKTICLKSPT